MTRRARRTHSAAFKVKVAMAAIKGDRTLPELARQFEVHPNRITAWKAQFIEGAADIFGASRTGAELAVYLKALHAKIGELTPRNNFLLAALGKAGLPGAKR